MMSLSAFSFGEVFMKEKNYHLFIVAYFIFDCLIRFLAAYSHGSLKTPVVGLFIL